MMGVNIDVTEAREAADHTRLLLRELNHRVKNTLAMIQSLARQTMRRSPDPEQFLEAFTRPAADPVGRARAALRSRLDRHRPRRADRDAGRPVPRRPAAAGDCGPGPAVAGGPCAGAWAWCSTSSRSTRRASGLCRRRTGQVSVAWKATPQKRLELIVEGDRRAGARGAGARVWHRAHRARARQDRRQRRELHARSQRERRRRSASRSR